MPEPISSSAATSTLTGLALLSLFPGLDIEVVLAAFAGAMVFIATTTAAPLAAKEAASQRPIPFCPSWQAS